MNKPQAHLNNFLLKRVKKFRFCNVLSLFVLGIFFVIGYVADSKAQLSAVDTYRKRADIILKARLNAVYALPPQSMGAVGGNSLVYGNSYECLTAQIVLLTSNSATNTTQINTRLDKLIAIQRDMNVKYTVLDNQMPNTRFVWESQWYAGYMLQSYLAIKAHLKTYNFTSPTTTQKLATYEAGVRQWYSKFDFTRLTHETAYSLTNLVLPRLFGSYLATELWPDAIDAYGKPFRRFRNVLKSSCLSTLYDFYHGGFSEIDAVSYVSLMATPVKMLGEYAQDTEVKRIAALSFQTILATISMDYNNGMSIVCPSRAKGIEINPTANNLHRMQWLFFGPGKEPYSNGTFIPNDEVYVRQMSVWMSLPGTLEASPQLLDVHSSKDSVITWFNDRQENGDYEKKYVLPHYAVGSAISKGQAAGIGEGKNNIVGWRNLDNSTDFTTVCVENNGNDRTKDGENPHTRLFQNQKTIIGTTNIPTTVSDKDYYRLFLPIDYTTDQTDKGYIYDLSKPNWIFCHTGRMMYGVAFFGSKGAVPKLQTQDPLLFDGYSHYFLLDDRKAAWVMETADVNEDAYKGKSRQTQLNAFRDAITKSTTPRVVIDFTDDQTITYSSLSSGKLSLTHYAGNTYIQNMKLNDVPILNPYVDSVSNNPYMRQKVGSDIIELGKINSPQFYRLIWSGNMPPWIHPRVKMSSDKADFTYLDEDRPLIIEKGQTDVDGLVQFQGDDPESGKNVTYDIRYLNGPPIRRYGVGSTLRLDLVNLTQDTTIIFKVTDPQGNQTIDTVLVYVTRRPSAQFDSNRRNQYLPTENIQSVFTGKDILRKTFDIRIEDNAGNDIKYKFEDTRVDSITTKLNVNYFKTVGDYVIKGTTRNWVRATASAQTTIRIRNIVIQSPTPNSVFYKGLKTFNVTGAMIIPTDAKAIDIQLLVYVNNVVNQVLPATVSDTTFTITVPISNTLTASDKVQLVARLTYTTNGVQTELSYPLDVIINAETPGQVGLKLGTGSSFATKNTSAVLDLGTGNQGLLLPKVALTSKTSPIPLVGATFAAAAPAGMTVYNTATAGTAPNNVTPGIYYSDEISWNRNEEIITTNGLTKSTEIIKLGGTLTEHTTIIQNDFNFILKPATTASGMTFAKGNDASNNRIFMPSDGLELQSNETVDLKKPIIQVMNSQNERFRVQSDGKVGIGTNTPSHLFHINGGGAGVETVLMNLQANAGGATETNTGAAIRFSPTNPGGFNIRGAEIAAVNQGANVIDLVFRTTSASSNFVERVRIEGSGEVGIGTTSPSSTLHTNGTIAVTTGSTTTSSVILSSTNVTLPDATLSPGRIYMIRNTSASAAITVSSIIDYAATSASVYSLTATIGAITVISNGTSWYRVN